MANLATQPPRVSQSFFSNRPAYFRSWASAVLLLAATLFLLRLGDRSFWGSESRWGEITREMRLTGNYFWPTINGEVYYDKPLLSYWLIAQPHTLPASSMNLQFGCRVPWPACSVSHF
jgi:4-amino-4-deoxy-L-arabinose transferase-like glycosyltransferase